tara:strand:+ start:238 stop:1392 length:1155 start_codon:yes stop_codon:yes gene_type:complete
MAIDKAIDYVVQDGYENYTKNSDSVTVPRKFKSRKDATPTKLAYITKDEAKMLKKMKKGTPHKGPSGVPSYDDYDAKTGSYRSGAAMSAAETGGKTERDRADMRQAGISPQEAQALRSAAINAGAGQRVNPGFFDSKNTISPAELRAAKAARRDPNNLYGSKAYRNTRGGLMNFIQGGGLLGNLLSGLGSLFGLGKRYDEPTYDMSEGNALGLYNERVNPDYYNDLDNELMLSTQKTPERFLPNAGPRQVNIPAGDAVSTLANPELNRMKGYTDDYPNLGLINPTIDRFSNSVGPVPSQGINSIDIGQDDIAFQNDLMAGLTKTQKKMLAGPQKNLKNILGISDEEILNNISPFNDPKDPATLEEVQTFYGADGGLASMFTRRG